MNWLAALKPNVIRFPSGGQAKFTHLTTGPGYGFNIDEIEEYFLICLIATMKIVAPDLIMRLQ